MKTKILLVSLTLFFLGCEVPGELTRDGRQDSLAPGAVLKYSGLFSPTSGISVSGRARIYQTGNRYQLLLDGFSISDGPDLKVYLSKTPAANDFINLGNLTTATIYQVPGAVDFTVYKYVLIHCQQYNHLFATAELFPD